MILSLLRASVTPRRQYDDMTNQLTLITPHRSWRLDSSTKQRGLDGIAAARAVLLESRIHDREVAESEATPTAEAA